mmetsp:Transcript_5807/g.10437  ORF Transcript_5807/g.10437 Transcript_5807/m.10437 type:complete len:96 (+) Transcript_5807:389-676(+)
MWSTVSMCMPNQTCCSAAQPSIPGSTPRTQSDPGPPRCANTCSCGVPPSWYTCNHSPSATPSSPPPQPNAGYSYKKAHSSARSVQASRREAPCSV